MKGRGPAGARRGGAPPRCRAGHRAVPAAARPAGDRRRGLPTARI